MSEHTFSPKEIAAKVLERLLESLDDVAANRGRVRMEGGSYPVYREVIGLTDAEVAAYLAGMRQIAGSIVGFVEDYIEAPSAAFDAVDAEIAGAQGGCLFRRHGASAVFGAQRKASALINEVRAARVKLRDDLSAAYRAGKGSAAALEPVAAFAHERIMRGFDVLDELRKFQGDEACAAKSRILAELASLKTVCESARKEYGAALESGYVK